MLEVIINDEKYSYDGDLNIPVTVLLDKLNVEYSCSCLQGLCGSCAMLINNEAKLACKTFLNEELMTNKHGKITINPLSKFPLINGLKIDRSKLYESLKSNDVYLKSDASINLDDVEFEYELSKCLMCGCCVETCPNYGFDDFAGTPFALSLAKITNQEKNNDHLKKLNKNYKKDFFNHCVKSLACEDICPMNIGTQRAISQMNRTAVWKLRNLFK